MKKIALFFVIAAGLILFVSCGTSTRVVSSWKTPSIPANALNKVLVMGMLSDREAKDYIEQTMVGELTAKGSVAVTGTAEFGPRGFGNLTQEQINRKLTSEGFTSIIIVCLTDKDRDLEYVPGTYYSSPYGSYYGYYGHYSYLYDSIYSPGYYTTSTTYTLDANMYSLPDDTLIYSAQTRSYDPANNRELALGFSERIVNDLSEKGVLNT